MMTGEKITTLVHLLDKIRIDILKSINLIWKTNLNGNFNENINAEAIKKDILTSYTDTSIFRTKFNQLSKIEQTTARYIAETPSGMSLKDVVSELSKEKNWNKKDTLNSLKKLFNKYFCIPLKSSSDMILFIPREFREQMSKLEDIDESLLNFQIISILPQIVDLWRLKQIAKNLGISVIGEKKHIAKRIGQESTFDNLMVALTKKEIQNIIEYLNYELELNLNSDINKSELIIQIRKMGKEIIREIIEIPPKYPISPLKYIINTIKENEINYNNRDELFPARKIIAYLYYSDEYIATIYNCYKQFEYPYYEKINFEKLQDAIDILYDLGIIIIEHEDENNNFIKLNSEFYKESTINIEEYITCGIDTDRVYNNINIPEKFIIYFIVESYEPLELEMIKNKFDTRFKEGIFENALKLLINNNIVFICRNNNKDNLFIPRIFRKKLRDFLNQYKYFNELNSIINPDMESLYKLLDKKEEIINNYKFKLYETETELENLKNEIDYIIRDNSYNYELESELLNDKNKLLIENNKITKINEQLKNDLMELRSRIIVYDDNTFDIEEFRTLAINNENKERFAEYLVHLLNNLGLSTKINTDELGPNIISVASAPDVAIMIDFKLGDNSINEPYPFGIHFQTDEYILNSDLKKYSKVIKIFIAMEFYERTNIIRLAKRYNIKLIRIDQLVELYNIYNIMPIPQEDIINLFSINDIKDSGNIFVKDWQINELNKVINERKVKILRTILIYNELYKATDTNFKSRNAEGIYNNVKNKFIEKGLDPVKEIEIKQALENFSSPIIQMTLPNLHNNREDHFIPMLKPDALIKQIKFINQYLQEISEDLIIDDI